MADVVGLPAPRIQNSPFPRVVLTKPQAERKPRKSVQFEDSTTIVDVDGEATEGGPTNGDKDSAESHAPGTQSSHTTTASNGADSQAIDADKEVDEVTDMFAGLAKKVHVAQTKTAGLY
jgi:hypothetical protein